MRIIAGTWRGKILTAPAGQATRPTAQRMRQAIFDMLMHAPWGGRALLESASVLDAFAGTGALGLEALSRGAAHAVFIDNDPRAIEALRANLAACKAQDRARIVRADVLQPPTGTGQTIVFVDPPYDAGLIQAAEHSLRTSGWIASGTLVVAETARQQPEYLERVQDRVILARKVHGAAKVNVWREP